MVFSKDWYRTNPHPRGMAGKTASPETRARMSKVRKGKLLPEGWAKNISKGKTGIPRSLELKQKLSEYRKKAYADGTLKPRYGSDNNLWNGGKSSENKLIRNRREYKEWRISVFERDNYTCVFCGARNGNGKTIYLQADHIKPFALYPELRFELSNGRTLCIDCHKKTDSYLNSKIERVD